MGIFCRIYLVGGEKVFHKFPFVKQQDEKECGSCALLMIIRYYHGNYSLKELNNLTHTTHKGTTAYDLLEASKKIGFEARGVTCDLNKITKEDVILPCIAHINTNNGGHFVVVYKISFKKQELWIADPATGLKKYSFLKFQQQWTKNFLFLYPIRKIDFHKESNLLLFSIQILKQQHILIRQVLCLSFLVILSSIGTSFYIKSMMEFLSKRYSIDLFKWILIFFGLLYMMKDISFYFRNLLLAYLNQKIDLTLFLETFEHLLYLPYSYLKTKTTGDIMNRIYDITVLKNTFLEFLVTVFVDSLLCLNALIILFFIYPKVGIETIVLIIFYFTLLYIFQPWIKKYILYQKQEQSILSSTVTETILGMESIKGLHLEKKRGQVLETTLLPVIENQFKVEKMLYLKNFFMSVIKDGSYLLILATIIYEIYQGKISSGSFFLVQSLLFYIFDPIEQFMKLDLAWKEGTLAFQRLLDLFIQEEEKTSFKKLTLKNITLKNIVYEHENQKILSNISLNIKQGEKILLVGGSGSGKSSLLKLLMKYDKPSGGEIYYNDINLSHYSKESLSKNISYLSQKELLFTATLKENIMMNRKYLEKNLKKILSICEVDKIVKTHPLGYNMFLEEDGFNLSGGEKQRIILARHLLNPSPFLLIDEGFSQMDTSLERRILKRIFEAYPQKTFVIVSHRLDNMDLFSRMIRLEKGHIINDVSK